jgi:TfoX/Sxy family transcriptional regulator of competence genes
MRRDHDPKQLLASIQPWIEALPFATRSKAMFGGYGVYADEKIFLSLSNVGIGLKLSAAQHAELLSLGGEGLSYEPNMPPSKSYAVPPDDWYADTTKLRTWIEKSATFVTSKK